MSAKPIPSPPTVPSTSHRRTLQPYPQVSRLDDQTITRLYNSRDQDGDVP